MSEELLSLKEAAKYLGVSQSSVRNYIAKSGLKARRVGPKLIKFRRADLDAFVNR